MFRFEKFDVWHRAVEFADRVYCETKQFPPDERFGLARQMRRAAVSISSNIAEGTSRSSDKDFAHFVEIAYGSLLEVVSQSHVAFRQSFLRKEQLDGIVEAAEMLAKMLSGLKTSFTR